MTHRLSIFVLITLAILSLAGVGVASFYAAPSEPSIPIQVGEHPGAGENPAREPFEREAAMAYLFKRAERDYTTYTHPTLGYAFPYLSDFTLYPGRDGDAEIVQAASSRFGLQISVITRPAHTHKEILDYLASLPDEYDVEAPEGADSTAVGWIDQDVPYEGQYRGEMWFVDRDTIYQIMLTAPDAQVLDIWMKGFLYNEFQLPS